MYRNHATVPHAPAYYPTKEQFANPIAFIQSIRPEAEKYGICKIVPPPDWRPAFSLNADLAKFQTKVQMVDKLQTRTDLDRELLAFRVRQLTEESRSDLLYVLSCAERESSKANRMRVLIERRHTRPRLLFKSLLGTPFYQLRLKPTSIQEIEEYWDRICTYKQEHRRQSTSPLSSKRELLKCDELWEATLLDTDRLGLMSKKAQNTAMPKDRKKAYLLQTHESIRRIYIARLMSSILDFIETYNKDGSASCNDVDAEKKIKSFIPPFVEVLKLEPYKIYEAMKQVIIDNQHPILDLIQSDQQKSAEFKRYLNALSSPCSSVAVSRMSTSQLPLPSELIGTFKMWDKVCSLLALPNSLSHETIAVNTPFSISWLKDDTGKEGNNLRTQQLGTEKAKFGTFTDGNGSVDIHGIDEVESQLLYLSSVETILRILSDRSLIRNLHEQEELERLSQFNSPRNHTGDVSASSSLSSPTPVAFTEMDQMETHWLGRWWSCWLNPPKLYQFDEFLAQTAIQTAPCTREKCVEREWFEGHAMLSKDDVLALLAIDGLKAFDMEEHLLVKANILANNRKVDDHSNGKWSNVSQPLQFQGVPVESIPENFRKILSHHKDWPIKEDETNVNDSLLPLDDFTPTLSVKEQLSKLDEHLVDKKSRFIEESSESIDNGSLNSSALPDNTMKVEPPEPVQKHVRKRRGRPPMNKKSESKTDIITQKIPTEALVSEYVNKNQFTSAHLSSTLQDRQNSYQTSIHDLFLKPRSELVEDGRAELRDILQQARGDEFISQLQYETMRCEQCGSGDQDDFMLICDGCERAYHMFCTAPPLVSVPETSWYCQTCLDIRRKAFGSSPGRAFSLREYQQYADSFRASWFQNVILSRSALDASASGQPEGAEPELVSRAIFFRDVHDRNAEVYRTRKYFDYLGVYPVHSTYNFTDLPSPAKHSIHENLFSSRSVQDENGKILIYSAGTSRPKLHFSPSHLYAREPSIVPYDADPNVPSRNPWVGAEKPYVSPYFHPFPFTSPHLVSQQTFLSQVASRKGMSQEDLSLSPGLLPTPLPRTPKGGIIGGSIYHYLGRVPSMLESDYSDYLKPLEDVRKKWFGNRDRTEMSEAERVVLGCESPDHIGIREVEREFWRIVDGSRHSRQLSVSVEYGSDVDAESLGSALPDHPKYQNAAFNPSNLGLLKDSCLQLLDNTKVGGVTVPWYYIGMLFSTFCWHAEDHNFYALNYMHLGAPKHWYGVSGEGAAVLESRAGKLLPHLLKEQPDLLFQMITVVQPQLLNSQILFPDPIHPFPGHRYVPESTASEVARKVNECLEECGESTQSSSSNMNRHTKAPDVLTLLSLLLTPPEDLQSVVQQLPALEHLRTAGFSQLSNAARLLQMSDSINDENQLVVNSTSKSHSRPLVHQLIQYPGEIIITFPQAYHTGFNHGFNIAESVNFAPPSWLPYGIRCVARYRHFHRTPVFSHDQLVTHLVRRATLDIAEFYRIRESKLKLISSDSDKMSDAKSESSALDISSSSAASAESLCALLVALRRMIRYESASRQHLRIMGVRDALRWCRDDEAQFGSESLLQPRGSLVECSSKAIPVMGLGQDALSIPIIDPMIVAIGENATRSLSVAAAATLQTHSINRSDTRNSIGSNPLLSLNETYFDNDMPYANNGEDEEDGSIAIREVFSRTSIQKEADDYKSINSLPPYSLRAWSEYVTSFKSDTISTIILHNIKRIAEFALAENHDKRLLSQLELPIALSTETALLVPSPKSFKHDFSPLLFNESFKKSLPFQKQMEFMRLAASIPSLVLGCSIPRLSMKQMLFPFHASLFDRLKASDPESAINSSMFDIEDTRKRLRLNLVANSVVELQNVDAGLDSSVDRSHLKNGVGVLASPGSVTPVASAQLRDALRYASSSGCSPLLLSSLQRCTLEPYLSSKASQDVQNHKYPHVHYPHPYPPPPLPSTSLATGATSLLETVRVSIATEILEGAGAGAGLGTELGTNGISRSVKSFDQQVKSFMKVGKQAGIKRSVAEPGAPLYYPDFDNLLDEDEDSKGKNSMTNETSKRATRMTGMAGRMANTLPTVTRMANTSPSLTRMSSSNAASPRKTKEKPPAKSPSKSPTKMPAKRSVKQKNKRAKVSSKYALSSDDESDMDMEEDIYLNDENEALPGAWDSAVDATAEADPTTRLVVDSQCCVCRYAVHVSCVRCPCSRNKLVCLSHWRELCTCPASRRYLLYRYSIAELVQLTKMVEKFAWEATGRSKWQFNTLVARATMIAEDALRWEPSVLPRDVDFDECYAWVTADKDVSFKSSVKTESGLKSATPQNLIDNGEHTAPHLPGASLISSSDKGIKLLPAPVHLDNSALSLSESIEPGTSGWRELNFASYEAAERLRVIVRRTRMLKLKFLNEESLCPPPAVVEVDENGVPHARTDTVDSFRIQPSPRAAGSTILKIQEVSGKFVKSRAPVITASNPTIQHPWMPTFCNESVDVETIVGSVSSVSSASNLLPAATLPIYTSLGHTFRSRVLPDPIIVDTNQSSNSVCGLASDSLCKHVIRTSAVDQVVDKGKEQLTEEMSAVYLSTKSTLRTCPRFIPTLHTYSKKAANELRHSAETRIFEGDGGEYPADETAELTLGSVRPRSMEVPVTKEVRNRLFVTFLYPMVFSSFSNQNRYNCSIADYWIASRAAAFIEAYWHTDKLHKFKLSEVRFDAMSKFRSVIDFATRLALSPAWEDILQSNPELKQLYGESIENQIQLTARSVALSKNSRVILSILRGELRNNWACNLYANYYGVDPETILIQDYVGMSQGEAKLSLMNNTFGTKTFDRKAYLLNGLHTARDAAARDAAIIIEDEISNESLQLTVNGLNFENESNSDLLASALGIHLDLIDPKTDQECRVATQRKASMLGLCTDLTAAFARKQISRQIDENPYLRFRADIRDMRRWDDDETKEEERLLNAFLTKFRANLQSRLRRLSQSSRQKQNVDPWFSGKGLPKNSGELLKCLSSLKMDRGSSVKLESPLATPNNSYVSVTASGPSLFESEMEEGNELDQNFTSLFDESSHLMKNISDAVPQSMIAFSMKSRHMREKQKKILCDLKDAREKALRKLAQLGHVKKAATNVESNTIIKTELNEDAHIVDHSDVQSNLIDSHVSGKELRLVPESLAAESVGRRQISHLPGVINKAIERVIEMNEGLVVLPSVVTRSTRNKDISPTEGSETKDYKFCMLWKNDPDRAFEIGEVSQPLDYLLSEHDNDKWSLIEDAAFSSNVSAMDILLLLRPNYTKSDPRVNVHDTTNFAYKHPLANHTVKNAASPDPDLTSQVDLSYDFTEFETAYVEILTSSDGASGRLSEQITCNPFLKPVVGLKQGSIRNVVAYLQEHRGLPLICLNDEDRSTSKQQLTVISVLGNQVRIYEKDVPVLLGAMMALDTKGLELIEWACQEGHARRLCRPISLFGTKAGSMHEHGLLKSLQKSELHRDFCDLYGKIRDYCKSYVHPFLLKQLHLFQNVSETREVMISNFDQLELSSIMGCNERARYNPNIKDIFSCVNALKKHYQNVELWNTASEDRTRGTESTAVAIEAAKLLKEFGFDCPTWIAYQTNLTGSENDPIFPLIHDEYEFTDFIFHPLELLEGLFKEIEIQSDDAMVKDVNGITTNKSGDTGLNVSEHAASLPMLLLWSSRASVTIAWARTKVRYLVERVQSLADGIQEKGKDTLIQVLVESRAAFAALRTLVIAHRRIRALTVHAYFLTNERALSTTASGSVSDSTALSHLAATCYKTMESVSNRADEGHVLCLDNSNASKSPLTKLGLEASLFGATKLHQRLYPLGVKHPLLAWTPAYSSAMQGSLALWSRSAYYFLNHPATVRWTRNLSIHIPTQIRRILPSSETWSLTDFAPVFRNSSLACRLMPESTSTFEGKKNVGINVDEASINLPWFVNGLKNPLLFPPSLSYTYGFMSTSVNLAQYENYSDISKYDTISLTDKLPFSLLHFLLSSGRFLLSELFERPVTGKEQSSNDSSSAMGSALRSILQHTVLSIRHAEVFESVSDIYLRTVTDVMKNLEPKVINPSPGVSKRDSLVVEVNDEPYRLVSARPSLADAIVDNLSLLDFPDDMVTLDQKDTIGVDVDLKPSVTPVKSEQPRRGRPARKPAGGLSNDVVEGLELVPPPKLRSFWQNMSLHSQIISEPVYYENRVGVKDLYNDDGMRDVQTSLPSFMSAKVVSLERLSDAYKNCLSSLQSHLVTEDPFQMRGRKTVAYAKELGDEILSQNLETSQTRSFANVNFVYDFSGNRESDEYDKHNKRSTLNESTNADDMKILSAILRGDLTSENVKSIDDARSDVPTIAKIQDNIPVSRKQLHAEILRISLVAHNSVRVIESSIDQNAGTHPSLEKPVEYYENTMKNLSKSILDYVNFESENLKNDANPAWSTLHDQTYAFAGLVSKISLCLSDLITVLQNHPPSHFALQNCSQLRNAAALCLDLSRKLAASCHEAVIKGDHLSSVKVESEEAGVPKTGNQKAFTIPREYKTSIKKVALVGKASSQALPIILFFDRFASPLAGSESGEKKEEVEGEPKFDDYLSLLQKFVNTVNTKQYLLEEFGLASQTSLYVEALDTEAEKQAKRAGPKKYTRSLTRDGSKKISALVRRMQEVQFVLSGLERIVKISRGYYRRQCLGAGLLDTSLCEETLYPELKRAVKSELELATKAINQEGASVYLDHVTRLLSKRSQEVIVSQHCFVKSTLIYAESALSSTDRQLALKNLHYPHVLASMGIDFATQAIHSRKIDSTLIDQKGATIIASSKPDQMRGGLQMGDIEITDDGFIRSYCGALETDGLNQVSKVSYCAGIDAAETQLNAPTLPMCGRIPIVQLYEEIRIWLHIPVYVDDDDEFDDFEEDEQLQEPAFLVNDLKHQPSSSSTSSTQTQPNDLNEYLMSAEEACAVENPKLRERALMRAAVLAGSRQCALDRVSSHVPPPLLRIDAPIGMFGPAQYIWLSTARTWPIMPPAPALSVDSPQWTALSDRLRRCGKVILPAMITLSIQCDYALGMIETLAMGILSVKDEFLKAFEIAVSLGTVDWSKKMAIRDRIESLFTVDSDMHNKVSSLSDRLPCIEETMRVAQDLAKIPVALPERLEDEAIAFLRTLSEMPRTCLRVSEDPSEVARRNLYFLFDLRIVLKILKLAESASRMLEVLNEYSHLRTFFSKAEQVVIARILRASGQIDTTVQLPDCSVFETVSSPEALAVHAGTFPYSPAAMMRKAMKEARPI